MFKSESESHSSFSSVESLHVQDDNEDNDGLPTSRKLISENQDHFEGGDDEKTTQKHE